MMNMNNCCLKNEDKAVSAQDSAAFAIIEKNIEEKQSSLQANGGKKKSIINITQDAVERIRELLKINPYASVGNADKASERKEESPRSNSGGQDHGEAGSLGGYSEARNEERNKALRIEVKMGGCAGISYNFSLVREPEQGDEIVLCEDVAVYIAKKAIFFIINSDLDYVDLGNFSKKFIFRNPNAKGGCGCGESFAV